MNLDAIPIYDHHAHALFQEPFWRDAPFESYFTEAYDPVIVNQFVPDNIFYRRSLRDLAVFYGCEPSRAAILEARSGWDYQELSRRMFQDAGIEKLLLDDGIWTDKLMPFDACGAFVNVPVRRVLRLETELALMVERFETVSALFTAFEEHLHKLAPTLAGLKSIVAYRTGLAIEHHSPVELQRAYHELRQSIQSGVPTRIDNKVILDEMLWLALRVAAELDLPVQFHTGYGDPDLDLRLANPLHLRSILEAKELAGLRVVMLHCYPFVREAGYLASVYSGAYLDLGLTIPYTSTHAMRESVHHALHLAPATKILFSTDAQRTPELFWLAAKHGRAAIAHALERTVMDGDLTMLEAEWAAERFLNVNAKAVYEGTN
jgi:uncharacterized protein